MIPPLELALVKDLHGDDRRVFHDTDNIDKQDSTSMSVRYIHVEILIPVGVESLFNDASRVRLLCIDSDHRERIRQSKDITLGEAVGRDNCIISSEICI